MVHVANPVTPGSGVATLRHVVGGVGRVRVRHFGEAVHRGQKVVDTAVVGLYKLNSVYPKRLLSTLD
jgi:hypothetical protein